MNPKRQIIQKNGVYVYITNNSEIFSKLGEVRE